MYRFVFTLTLRHVLKSDKYKMQIKITFAPNFSSGENINLFYMCDKSPLSNLPNLHKHQDWDIYLVLLVSQIFHPLKSWESLMLLLAEKYLTYLLSQNVILNKNLEMYY